MSLNDLLSNVLSNILNSEKAGKSECLIKPASKLILEVLKIMKEKGYIADFKKIEDGRGGLIKISLNGRINKCGVIKPRFSVTYKNIEKYEKRFLPAKDFGFIIISSPKGLVTNDEAKEKKIGGRLISYFY